MGQWRGNHVLISLWERHSRVVTSLKQHPLGTLSDSPLMGWVLPEDRGVPFALIRRTVGSVLNSTFEQLAETPGVGLRKLGMLIELLERVRNSWSEGATSNGRTAIEAPTTNGTSVTTVAKRRQWSEDVRAIRGAALEDVPLGRSAPSLIAIPHSLWDTPLSRFTTLDYDGLFSIPYFGSRRIESVIGIVSEVARIVRSSDGRFPPEELVQAPNIQAIQHRVRAWLAAKSKLGCEDVARELIAGLLQQLAVDNGRRAVTVAGRLLNVGAEGDSSDAHNGDFEACGLSRPRVSQIKSDIYEIFKIRWPQRKELLDALVCKAIEHRAEPRAVASLLSVRELLVGKASMSALTGTWVERPNSSPL